MANNPYVNKVQFGNRTLIDISDTTATADKILSGYGAYGADGAWMDGTASGGGGMSVVETQDSHGGTIVTITGEPITLQSKTLNKPETQTVVEADTGYTGLSSVIVNPTPWNWIGHDPELIKTIAPIEVALEDTDFNGWTPSSTAKVILSTQVAGTYTATDMENYNYVNVWDMSIPIYYTGSPVDKARPVLSKGCIVQMVFRRPGSWTTIQSETYNYNVTAQASLVNFLRYWNSPSSGSPTLTYTWGASYGFYYAQTASTISSTSASSPTITLKTPTVSARTSSTYMSAANAALVDQENTIITISCNVYRVKSDSYSMGLYRHMISLMQED